MTSTSEVSTEEWTALAESRSRIYGFLAAIFNRLPDDQFAESLVGPDMASFFSSLTEMDDLPDEMREGVALVESFARASEGKSIEELRNQLAVDRTRLVRGIKPGYGPPPPYESVYAGSEEAPKLQAAVSVRQVYAEAGVALPEEVRDQPDFIGFELDFMRHLTAKEAQAWADGDSEEALNVLREQQRFLDTHITRWIPRFCDVMAKEARLGFYQGVAKMTKGFVLDEAEKVVAYLEWGAATASASHGGKDE